MRPHPRTPYTKGVEGRVGPCWPRWERERRTAVHTKEGGGTLGYVGGRVKSRWSAEGCGCRACCLADWRGRAPKVAYLIELAAPQVRVLMIFHLLLESDAAEGWWNVRSRWYRYIQVLYRIGRKDKLWPVKERQNLYWRRYYIVLLLFLLWDYF